MATSLTSYPPLPSWMSWNPPSISKCSAALRFCLGISVIVGILLTALAGIEYRQNEYIYTLMKSFGIRPMLLVAAFITENLILVGGSAVAALAVFMHSQDYIVLHLLKLGKYSITLPEIMTELHLIGITLLACVFASSIPVFLLLIVISAAC